MFTIGKTSIKVKKGEQQNDIKLILALKEMGNEDKCS